MTDELKRNMAPAYPDATRAPIAVPDAAGRPTKTTSGAPTDARAAEARWFEAVDPTAAAAPTRRGMGAVPLTALALLCVTFGHSLLLRALLPVALAVVALIVLMRSRRSPPGRVVTKRRGIDLEPGHLRFRGAGASRPETLLCTSEPFGVTLLTTPRRDRAIALLTSPTGTFCVGGVFDGSARRSFAPLFQAAFTVSSDEVGLDAIGPDGEPLLLGPADFAALLGALSVVEPACFERIVLSDARGAPLLLDGRALRVGDRSIDLAVPLEWRGLVFQEEFGPSIAVYQGTWIRQGATEIVLVSLLPSIASAGAASIADGSPLSALDRSMLRDLRLMQALPERPPPREQRVAIDRLFMLPVRSALDKAPRHAKHPFGRAQRQ